MRASDQSTEDPGVTKSAALKSKVLPDIGRYHFVAELAQGGMGNVYLATVQGPGGFRKLVAIKELKPEFADDEAYVAMFHEEAKLAARLIHPNIVQTNEVGAENGRHFMVMEYLDGRSLYRVKKRLGAQLSIGAHLRVLAEAFSGLHYVHELRGFDGEPLGIVHRDISPLNIVITFDGQAKVLDFGIAKTVDSSLETKMGVVKGRLAYMAPEQARGAKVDRRADIYAAGVMIWEAAAGRRLWPNMGEVAILTRLLREPAPTLRSVRPQAPADLDAICSRAMAHAQSERYASLADLLRDLEKHLAGRQDAMTMREVGTIVGLAFADERRAMSAAIEDAQLRWRRGPSSALIPTSRAQRVVLEEPNDAVWPLLTLSKIGNPLGPSVSLSAPPTSVSIQPETAIIGIRSSPSRNARRVTFAAGVLFLIASLFGAESHRGTSLEIQAAATESMSTAPLDARILERLVVVAPLAPSPPVTPLSKAGHARADALTTTIPPIERSRDPNPRSTRPPQVGRRGSPPPPAGPTPNCQPPYTVDLTTGIKRWRLECL